MFTYNQSTGELRDAAGKLLHVGYSGAGVGKNNPQFQMVHDVGPIPVGDYTIGAPHDTVTRGPYVLPLIPDELNEMFGRSGFLMHGDAIRAPGTASEGCVIMGRATRVLVATTPQEHRLRVISGLPMDHPVPDLSGNISV